MTRTIFTLALAAQLVAGTAFAQSTATATQTDSMATGSETFGSDWTPTLSLALLDIDGTHVRTDSEISAQWQTLPDEDKELIRRDCELLDEQSDEIVGMSNDATDDSAMNPNSDIGAASDTGTGDMAESADPMTEAAPDISSDIGTADSGAMMSEDDSVTTVTVSAEQMQEICDATNDL
ncbi:MAG: hypothetical protein IKD58_02440 [Loktanella sp.]|nr:hypothetical protein [Loktanella sp.]